jgi:hypothetical protein
VVPQRLHFFIRNLQQLYTVFVLLPLATGGISCNYSSLSVVCPYGTLSIRRLISAIEAVYNYRTDRDKSQIASPSSILPSREKWLVVTISQPRHSRLKVTFFFNVCHLQMMKQLLICWLLLLTSVLLFF